MKIITRVSRLFLTVNRYSFYASAALLLCMCLIMTYEVIMRYIFNKPTSFSTELSGYLVVAIVFFAAAYVLQQGGHIRVDTLVLHFPKKVRQVLDVVLSIFALGYVGTIVWWGWILTWTSYTLDFHSSSMFGPPLWIPQVIIPIGTLFLSVELVRAIGVGIASLTRKSGV